MMWFGDVQVVQVGAVPAGARRVQHSSLGPWGAIYFETEAGVGFVRVVGSFVDLTHEEHGTIRLPGPAVYRLESSIPVALVGE